jgi:putative transposase
MTDAVMAEFAAWQAQPLEPMYPVILFDALRGSGWAPACRE